LKYGQPKPGCQEGDKGKMPDDSRLAVKASSPIEMKETIGKLEVLGENWRIQNGRFWSW
jgi:hypothetical protein